MASFKPRLAFQVANRLREGGETTNLNVELNFNEIDDFTPSHLAKQIKPLARLLEARNRLNDLLCKLDGNDTLEAILGDLAADKAKLAEVKKLSASSEESTSEAEKTETKPTEKKK